MNTDVFHAIADPTRREILGLTATKSLNINSVSAEFKISRAAVYKHIKILKEAGLVEIKKQGRERFCSAKLEKLSLVSDWIEQYKKLWNKRLDALEDYLEEIQKGTKY